LSLAKTQARVFFGTTNWGRRVFGGG
jgi:hypothetical protein